MPGLKGRYERPRFLPPVGAAALGLFLSLVVPEVAAAQVSSPSPAITGAAGSAPTGSAAPAHTGSAAASSNVPALCRALLPSRVSSVVGVNGLALGEASAYQVPPSSSSPYVGWFTQCLYGLKSDPAKEADEVYLTVGSVGSALASSRSKQVAEVKGLRPGAKLSHFGKVSSLGTSAYSFRFTKKGANGYVTGIQDFKGKSIYQVTGGQAMTTAKAAKLIKLMLAIPNHHG